MILTKQEWMVKEKIIIPALIASNDNMDLLDDDESLLIKDGSPPPTSMDINMVFTLSVKFRGVNEEIAPLCLGPKEAVFEKPKESSQHLKSLYVRGHIDRWLVFRMLVDDGAAVNLMSYSVFQKLGREDNELMKTDLRLNDVGGGGGNPMEARSIVSMELTVGTKSLATAFFVVEVQGSYNIILGCDWIHAKSLCSFYFTSILNPVDQR
jgi:hypothetical protein